MATCLLPGGCNHHCLGAASDQFNSRPPWDWKDTNNSSTAKCAVAISAGGTCASRGYFVPPCLDSGRHAHRREKTALVGRASVFIIPLRLAKPWLGSNYARSQPPSVYINNHGEQMGLWGVMCTLAVTGTGGPGSSADCLRGGLPG
eukprot:534646-Prorocentrum_minimum.AAC.1